MYVSQTKTSFLGLLVRPDELRERAFPRVLRAIDFFVLYFRVRVLLVLYFRAEGMRKSLPAQVACGRPVQEDQTRKGRPSLATARGTAPLFVRTWAFHAPSVDVFERCKAVSQWR